MSVIETIKKRIENNPAIAQFGWLLAIVILVNSFLPSILSYSAEVWLDHEIIKYRNSNSGSSVIS